MQGAGRAGRTSEPPRMIAIALVAILAVASRGEPVEESVLSKRSPSPGIISDPQLEGGFTPIIGLSSGIGSLGGGRLVSQLVEVQNNVAVSQPVGVPHPVPVALPVAVPHPVPVSVPVPIPVVKTVSVPVEKPVPFPVIRKVPVEVVRKVPVPVIQPFPVKVPIYKTRNIYYDIIPKHTSHGW